MNGNEYELFERLAWRYFDRRLEASEEAELLELLRSNTLLCKRFAEISIVNAALDRAVNIKHDSALTMRQARWRLVFRGMAAAAAVLLTVLGAFWLVSKRGDSPMPLASVTFSEMTGEITVVRGDKTLTGLIGMRLELGDQVKTGADSYVTLKDHDTGMRVGLAADTALTLEDPDRRWHLTAGKIAVSASFTPDRTLTFTTPNARTIMVGTRFELVAAADLTRVTVEEGAVDFADLASGASVRVQAGYAAVATPRAPPTAFRLATTEGLLALYVFNERQGDTVHDVSGIGDLMNLTIGNPANVEWLPDRLRVMGSADIALKGRSEKMRQAVARKEGITVEALMQLRIPDDIQPVYFFRMPVGRWRFTWTQTTQKKNPNAKHYIEPLNRVAFVLQEDGRQTLMRFFTDGKINSFKGIPEAGLLGQISHEICFVPSLDSMTRHDGYREWRGDILTLAIYGRALAPEELERATRPHPDSPTASAPAE